MRGTERLVQLEHKGPGQAGPRLWWEGLGLGGGPGRRQKTQVLTAHVEQELRGGRELGDPFKGLCACWHMYWLLNACLLSICYGLGKVLGSEFDRSTATLDRKMDDLETLTTQETHSICVRVRSQNLGKVIAV